jgi:hypothetical protein
MSHPYFTRHNDFSPKITEPIHPNLGICVVIPSYNEPNLWQSIQSIANCKMPQCAVEVIVVINFPEDADNDVRANAKTCIELVNKANKISNNPLLRFFPLEAFDMPKKHAGVGLARKTGMDQASWRLLQSINQYKILACYDADSTCESNYLTELERLWIKYPDTSACSIRYQHPIEGDEFDERIYNGICQYELHLRYYVQAGRFINHPFSFQTVGSSMACSADTYVKVGGMNKNKAGEDFYFLQKIIPHGNFRELQSTCIYPSPRPSYRVPFGTGRAITKFIDHGDNTYFTYNFNSFLLLKPFINNAPSYLFDANENKCEDYLNSLPNPLKDFLVANNFINAIKEINSNTSTIKAFEKRFFLWFDAFKLLKFLNGANELHFAKRPIVEESLQLLKYLNSESTPKEANAKNLLLSYREIDRKEKI